MACSLISCGKKELSWQEQYDLGVRYLSDGNYKEAIIAFEAAIKIEPGSQDSYMQAAEAYLASGDNDGAANVLLRGYAAIGNEIFLCKIWTSAAWESVFRESYEVDDANATFYNGIEAPGVEGLRDESGALSTDGDVAIFNEPLVVEILGVEMRIDHVAVSYLDGTEFTTINSREEREAFYTKYNGKSVVLSGHIGFSHMAQEYQNIEIVETAEGLTAVKATGADGFEIYIPGGFWDFGVESMELQ